MQFCIKVCLFAQLLCSTLAFTADEGHHHHHKGHHKGHHKRHHGKHSTAAAKVEPSTSTAQEVAAQLALHAASARGEQVEPIVATKTGNDEEVVAKMKVLELRLSKQKKVLAIKAEKLAEQKKVLAIEAAVEAEKGQILVNGPLPADFSERFSQSVAQATGADAAKVIVTKTVASKDQPNVFAIAFKADAKTVKAVETQAADPDSKLAKGNLQVFLEADSGAAESTAPVAAAATAGAAVPVESKGIDIDTAMPYGELEPFGREDTAQELTESAVTESNSMVDQLERAEVAEEKRSVFRALTRLRGAAITSFDGVARSQTGNIDEYNKIHQWRTTHPLHHLADEESDVSKWAFPDNADF